MKDPITAITSSKTIDEMSFFLEISKILNFFGTVRSAVHELDALKCDVKRKMWEL